MKWQIVNDDLLTKWGKNVNPKFPLPEYPRPNFQREKWINLNGIWDYAITKRNNYSTFIDKGEIVVPFPIESALSGVRRLLKPDENLIYVRDFEISSSWTNGKVILHFGAVDWQARVFVNSNYIGSHKGGYTPFSFDISKYVLFDESNTLEVHVFDPTNKGRQERGKQVLKPWAVFYTAVSGIWQTVWLEYVPEVHVESITITPKVDSNSVIISNFCSNANVTNYEICYSVFFKGRKIEERASKINSSETIKLSNIHLWSPKDPNLYDLEVELVKQNETLDRVKSYFGVRKIEYKKDENGILRFYLNNEKIFMFGVLDQGYWPDGLYTAPTDEALLFDIKKAKELGFNTIRKHIKVEPLRWYYHCDREGMLVWQDFPNGGSLWAGILSMFTGKKINFKFGRKKESIKSQFYKETTEIVRSLYNFPSIVVWVPFNEGWGQFETRKVTDYVRTLDFTRLIDSASGWVDKGCGDIADIHDYLGPAIPKNDKKRVLALGEFGGLGLVIEDHVWKNAKPWAYKIMKNKDDFLKKYEEIINKTLEMTKKGLSAAIYTQITDVEKEVNGLLTYNRLQKVKEEKLRNINEKLSNLY